MRGIRILPTREHDASVLHNDRMPIAVLIKTESPHARAVGIHNVQVGHKGIATHARHTFISCR